MNCKINTLPIPAKDNICSPLNSPNTKVLKEENQKIGCLVRCIFALYDLLYNFTFDITAYLFYPIARKGVLYSSSDEIKQKCNTERFNDSRQVLKDFGGKEVIINSQGKQLHAMYFSYRECINTLIAKGAILDKVLILGQKKQKTILILPNKDLEDLVKKMEIFTYTDEQKTFIYIPDSDHSHEAKGAVIYAPGSGHLFEFRRPTIGTFVMDFGMNMFVFHYSGTGKSEGLVSEDSTYADMESAYAYLTTEKGIADDKILAYGHCAGAGPTLYLAAKYNLNAFIDRSFTRMDEFGRLRFHKGLKIPDFLWCLSAWVTHTLKKSFAYPNVERVKELTRAVVISSGSKDDLIPPHSSDALFDATLSENKIKLSLDLNHDQNFGADQKAKSELGKFLKKNGLTKGSGI